MENRNTETFNYTYSTKQQDEIKRIRSKYEQAELGTLEKLKALDKKVSARAVRVAVAVLAAGLLIMGFGMSLVMSELPAALGMSELAALVTGIIVGVVGMSLFGASYPVYRRVLERERKKASGEILRLSDELLMQ